MSEDEKGDLDFLLAALEDDDGEDLAEIEEKKYEKEDDKALKIAKATAEFVTKTEKTRQAEKQYETFMATASDTAKEIYAVLADDDMTPTEMKKVIDAANRKAASLEEKLAATAPEDEARARKIAAEAWGVGPLDTTGGRTGKDQYEELVAASKKGDKNASFALFLSAAPKPPR